MLLLPLVLFLQGTHLVRVTSNLMLLFAVGLLTTSLKSSTVFSENKNILQARSCNVFDCAVEAVTLGVLLTEVIAGNYVAAIATIIGGGQAVHSYSKLSSITETDRGRSVHVSSAYLSQVKHWLILVPVPHKLVLEDMVDG